MFMSLFQKLFVIMQKLYKDFKSKHSVYPCSLKQKFQQLHTLIIYMLKIISLKINLAIYSCSLISLLHNVTSIFKNIFFQQVFLKNVLIILFLYSYLQYSSRLYSMFTKVETVGNL